VATNSTTCLPIGGPPLQPPNAGATLSQLPFAGYIIHAADECNSGVAVERRKRRWRSGVVAQRMERSSSQGLRHRRFYGMGSLPRSSERRKTRMGTTSRAALAGVKLAAALVSMFTCRRPFIRMQAVEFRGEGYCTAALLDRFTRQARIREVLGVVPVSPTASLLGIASRGV
jgi:hypothetical protein